MSKVEMNPCKRWLLVQAQGQIRLRHRDPSGLHSQRRRERRKEVERCSFTVTSLDAIVEAAERPSKGRLIFRAAQNVIVRIAGA